MSRLRIFGLVSAVILILLLLPSCSVMLSSPRVAYLPDGRMVLLQSSGEDAPVEFPDANLELVVREKLESMDTLAAGESIYTTDLEEIVWLDASGRNITDLKGLESCINLGFLDLSCNGIVDLSPVGALPGALVYTVDREENVYTHTVLDVKLSRNSLVSLLPLAGLVGPDELSLFLSFNEIEDISPLEGLTNLINLYLCENRIVDLSPLSRLTGLTNLELWGNQIEDISSLSELTSLYWIELYRNNIIDVSPLSQLVNLDNLGLSSNNIQDVAPLAGLTNLRYLDLSSNNISDASALSSLKDTEINLEGNPLESRP